MDENIPYPSIYMNDSKVGAIMLSKISQKYYMIVTCPRSYWSLQEKPINWGTKCWDKEKGLYSEKQQTKMVDYCPKEPFCLGFDASFFYRPKRGVWGGKVKNKSDCCCLVTKSCPTFCGPMDCCMPGSPVLHYLPEFAQIHVHWVGDGT